MKEKFKERYNIFRLVTEEHIVPDGLYTTTHRTSKLRHIAEGIETHEEALLKLNEFSDGYSTYVILPVYSYIKEKN